MQGDVAVLDSTIRQLLRDHREAKALTQATLAARLGLPQSFIAKIETGERRLTAAELITLCRHLGMDVQELVAQVVTQLEQRYVIDEAANVATSKSSHKFPAHREPPDRIGKFGKS